LKTISIFLTAAGAALIIFNFAPRNSSIYIKCPFLDFTGLYCPGCGSMRCFHSLLHGDVSQALDFNPFTVFTLPFLLFAYIRFARREFTGEKENLIVKPFYVWGVVVFILVFWVLRNLPWYPFTVLAP